MMLNKQIKIQTAMVNIAFKGKDVKPNGGVAFILGAFDKYGLTSLADSTLGIRGKFGLGFSYGDILRTLCSSFIAGYDRIEDVNRIKKAWGDHHAIPSSDVVGRGLKELADYDVEREAKTGGKFRFNLVERMNELLVRQVKQLGLLEGRESVTVDFDHQLVASENRDTQWSYKKVRGNFPGIMSIGDIIVGVENRVGNAPVKAAQETTLENFFERLKDICGVKIGFFRADAGSYSVEIIKTVMKYCRHFLIRANMSAARAEMYRQHKDWMPTKIGKLHCEVASFEDCTLIEGTRLRLVVQRVPDLDDDGIQKVSAFGPEYVYRAIITNNWKKSERWIIKFYNRRGASERNFDMQNNDFGWAHMPFSHLNENGVFLASTAFAKNFYVFFRRFVSEAFPEIDCACRVKRFVAEFVSVPAKWIFSGRRWTLNLYSTHQGYRQLYDLLN